MATWRDFNDPEVDQYFQQARQGFVGADPKSQTMARSTSSPRIEAEGQRQLAQQDQANQQRVEQAAQDQARKAAETQRNNDRQQDAQSRMMSSVAKQKAKQAEADRLRQVRMMKAQGVKGDTDPITGHQSIATNPDGSPEYKAGKLPGTVGVETPESANMDLTKAIVGADQGDITGVTGAENVQPGHEYRNPYGETKAVVDKTKTDPKTGEIYTEEKDDFGAVNRVVTGHDPRWQEKNDLKQDQLRADFRRNQIIQAINNHATAWNPANTEFKKAKKALDKFKEDGWKEDMGGLQRTDPVTGKKYRIDDPEDVASFKKNLAIAKSNYSQAKKAYDPELAKHDALVKAHNSAKDQELSLRARRIKLALNLPEDDGGTAEILAGAEMSQESGLDPVVHGYINGIGDEETDSEGNPVPNPTGQAQNGTNPPAVGSTVSGDVVPESTPTTESGTNSPDKSKPTESRPLLSTDGDPAKIAAVGKAVGGLKNPEDYTVETRPGGSWIINKEGDNVALVRNDKTGKPFFTIGNSVEGEQLRRTVNIGDTSGNPVFLKEPDGTSIPDPVKSAQFVASVFSSLSASPPTTDPEEFYKRLTSLGASPMQIAEKVRKGEISIQSGEAIVKGTYPGLSLKPEDPNDQKVFHRWFVQQPAEVQKAWKNAATIEDSEAIKANFVKQWAKENAWKPTVDQKYLDREWKRMMPGRPSEGQLETAGRGLVMNTIPAIGTVIGAAIGGLLGIESGPGALATATAGGMAGAATAAALQKRVFTAVFGPAAMKEMELQQAANARVNPGAEMIGTMAPLLISCLGNPVGGSVKVEGKLLGRALTQSGKAAIAAGKTAPKLEAAAQNFVTGMRVGGGEKLTDWVNDKKNPDGSPINVMSVLNSMARGGVTFASLGFAPEAISTLPIAKNILIKAGMRGTSDAALMTLSGVMYDSITEGKIPDWKKAADQFDSSITPFVLQNLVMGALHRSVTGRPEPGKPGEEPPPDATGEPALPKPVVPTDGTGGKAAEIPPPEVDTSPPPEPPKPTGKQIVSRKMIVRSLMKQGVSEEHANQFANRWNGDLSNYNNAPEFVQAAKDAFKEIGGVFPNEVETKPEDFTSWKNQTEGVTDEQAKINAENARLQNERLKNEAHDQNAKALNEFKKSPPNEPNNQTTPTEPPAVAEVPVSEVPTGETPPASVEPVEGSDTPVVPPEAEAEAPVTTKETKPVPVAETPTAVKKPKETKSKSKGTLHQETSIGKALMLHPATSADVPFGAPDEYFATTPDLALGQGKNKGVSLEFDHSFETKANTSKPGLEFVAVNGGGEERTARIQPSELKKHLTAITLKKGAEGSRAENARLRGWMVQLEKQGWVKSTNDAGDITVRKPGSESLADTPPTPPADPVERLKGETPTTGGGGEEPAIESPSGNPELDAHIETITKGKSKAAREIRNRLSKADYESDALSDHKETKAEYLRRIICG